MKADVKTIPELLIASYGNQSTVAVQLNTQRSTVKKYANDSKGERHAIVNGRLMVGTTSRKRSA
ncbi:Phage NinH protein [Yersinia rohdei]|uniref:protein ninH n=1 Tax=Yersinia rohdei TaxID=29485 RepID=UPI00061CA98A|nr:protein ninH [Yersinia rohdei]CNF26578.1 Phage NinH protein [Yersinia rohdei]